MAFDQNPWIMGGTKSESTKPTKSTDFGQKSVDFWQILGQNPEKQQNPQNPQISAKNLQIFGRFWVRNLKNNKICKIHRFQPKIHGILADFRSTN